MSSTSRKIRKQIESNRETSWYKKAIRDSEREMLATWSGGEPTARRSAIINPLVHYVTPTVTFWGYRAKNSAWGSHRADRLPFVTFNPHTERATVHSGVTGAFNNWHELPANWVLL